MTLGLGAYPFQTEPKAGLGPTKSIAEENGVVNTGTALEQNDDPYKDTHRYIVTFIVNYLSYLNLQLTNQKVCQSCDVKSLT